MLCWLGYDTGASHDNLPLNFLTKLGGGIAGAMSVSFWSSFCVNLTLRYSEFLRVGATATAVDASKYTVLFFSVPC
jgi:hypothetical protein